MKPFVVINFKTYERGTGLAAAELAQICAEFGAAVAVQATDIRLVCAGSEAEVWAQHVDAVEYGVHTGHILPEAVAEAGAVGTLINHSEHRLSFEEVAARVKRCKEVGLKTMICAESVEEGETFLPLEADYIAVEIPELISGDTSIVTADPNIIRDAVARLGPNTLMGAGVRIAADIPKIMEDGGAGAILASAVVQKSDDPRAALQELYSAVK